MNSAAFDIIRTVLQAGSVVFGAWSGVMATRSFLEQRDAKRTALLTSALECFLRLCAIRSALDRNDEDMARGEKWNLGLRLDIYRDNIQRIRLAGEPGWPLRALAWLTGGTNPFDVWQLAGQHEPIEKQIRDSLVLQDELHENALNQAIGALGEQLDRTCENV